MSFDGFANSSIESRRGRGRGGRGRGGRGRGEPYQSGGGGGVNNYNNNNNNSYDNAHSSRGSGGRGGRPPRRAGSMRGGGGGGGGGTILEISGYPADTAYEEFVAFINANSPANFRWTSLSFNAPAGRTRMTVNNADAAAVIALSGRSIKGAALHIEAAAGHAYNNKALQQSDKDILRQFLQTRYNAQQHALGLNAMSAALPAIADFNNKAFVSELVTQVAAYPDTKSLALESNNISSLHALNHLHTSLANVRNLSLANNKISSVDQLEQLSGYKHQLVELVIAHNPIKDHLYRHVITHYFPSLTLLDGAPVQQLLHFDLPPLRSASELPPIKASFFDSENTRDVCNRFVTMYFPLLDQAKVGGGGRDSLLSAVYAEFAQFSLTVMTNDAKWSGVVPAEYLDINRGLFGRKGLGKCQVGAVDIVFTLKKLPPMQHDTASFTADCVIIPATQTSGSAILLTLKGQLIETATNTARSFHRVFILAPPTSESSVKGWPVTIVNEQLFIGGGRSAPPLQSTSPPPTVDAMTMNMSAIAAAAVANNVNPLIGALAQGTGVSPEIAAMALQQTNFNPDAAYALLLQNRTQ